MRSLLVLMLSTSLALIPSQIAHAATDYLVVTTEEMAAGYQVLANQKIGQGHVAEVVTLEHLAAMSVPGRDVPEQIRNYIRSVRSNGSLRYVLLGGDTEQVPTRYAHNDLYPAYGTLIPTDLYYAALDGDWDADADDVFGEVGVDDADLSPELAVGRAPTRNALEAAHYAAKVEQYENPSDTAYFSSVLYLHEVLFPSPWQPGATIVLDGAVLGEELRSIVEGGAATMTAERLYENYLDFPGSSPLTRLDALAAMDSGDHGLVLHGGHGYQTTLSVGDEVFQSADALALTNAERPFVMMSMSANSAALDSSTILEELLRNPNGGAVAAIGASRATFVLSVQEILRDLNEQLFVADVATLGEALQAVRVARSGDVDGNTVERYAQLTFQLLGDPELGVGENAIPTSTPVAHTGRLRIESVAPSPFNPSTRIRFVLDGDHGKVRVSVVDLAGHRVRSLWNGRLDEGPHDMVWDGRDDAGRPLGSGVYFATVESPDDRASVKMVLVK